MAKLPPGRVRYRPSFNLMRRCGTCSMFRKARGRYFGTCTLVAGRISPTAVCDRWEAK